MHVTQKCQARNHPSNFQEHGRELEAKSRNTLEYSTGWSKLCWEIITWTHDSQRLSSFQTTRAVAKGKAAEHTQTFQWLDMNDFAQRPRTFILWNGSNYSNHCNPAVLFVPHRMYMIICKMQRYFGYNFRMLWITSSACLLQLFPWVNHEWLHSCMCRTSWFRSQEGFQRKVNSWLQPSVLPELLLDDKHMTYLSKGF